MLLNMLKLHYNNQVLSYYTISILFYVWNKNCLLKILHVGI